MYAVIDHTKKGPIPAPPVELFEVQYTSVRGAGQQQLAALAHSCERNTAKICRKYGQRYSRAYCAKLNEHALMHEVVCM